MVPPIVGTVVWVAGASWSGPGVTGTGVLGPPGPLWGRLRLSPGRGVTRYARVLV